MDEVYDACIDILQNSDYGIQFEGLVKIACERNTRVKYHIGNKFKLQDNKKLRSVFERLRNHSRVVVISQRPAILKWMNG